MAQKERIPFSLSEKNLVALEKASKDTGFSKSVIVELLIVKYLKKEFNSAKSQK